MLNGYEKFAAKSVPKFVKSSRKSYEIALTVIMGHHALVDARALRAAVLQTEADFRK